MSTQPKSSSVSAPSTTSSQTNPPRPPPGNQKKDTNQPKSSGSKPKDIDDHISNNDIFALKAILGSEGTTSEPVSSTNTPPKTSFAGYSSGFAGYQQSGSFGWFPPTSIYLQGAYHNTQGSPFGPFIPSSEQTSLGSFGQGASGSFGQGASGSFGQGTPGSFNSAYQGSFGQTSAGSQGFFGQHFQGSFSQPYQGFSFHNAQGTPFRSFMGSNNQNPPSSFVNGYQGFTRQHPHGTYVPPSQGFSAYETPGGSRIPRTNTAVPIDEDIIPMGTEEPQAGNDNAFATNPNSVNAEVSTGSLKTSRFIKPICDVEIPKRFQTTKMRLYDGTTDPEEHVAHYRERMEINPIPAGIKEACLCKGYGATLTGSALKWLLSIPPHSVSSFAHLVNMFNNQFSCSRSFEKLTGDLYRVTQKSTESLRDYITRFGKESLEIPNLDMDAAVEAFKMGLQKNSLFYEDIDDKKIHQKLEIPKYESSNRKLDSPHKQYRSKPYNKQDSPRINAVEEEDEEEYPKISDYCFSVDTSILLCAMQDLGDKARWPRKNEKSFGWKDKSKWCAYHEDFGHNTDECIALRKEISYLLSKGHLKELLGRRKDKNQEKDKSKEKDKAPQRAPSPPPNAKTISFISGGSDICGTSYSSAKRHAKEAKSEYPERPHRNTSFSHTKVITFDEDDLEHIQDPHHDGLVVTLCIANCYVRRILVDGGSSVNIIQWEALKQMNILEKDIVPRSTVLVGFSGETKKTMGEITLPIYIEGVNTMQKFSVIDTLSCCNAILGRPWIHTMEAIPSTYHQFVKLPSPWGVQLKKDAQAVLEATEQDVKEVAMDPNDQEKKVYIGSDIPTNIKEGLLEFLKARSSTFAWKHDDMTGISKDVITHKLNVDKSFRPIHQKRRKFAPERNLVIQEEVEKLLKAGMIREVMFPRWLANVVVVQKKNGKWRVCVDYTDLNKACPKDPFPLPHIDSMVDSIAGHEILTFMDASSGFQQIQMEPSDQEDTTFMTPSGIYCYIAMPFGLKNAGATYQRLVNMMFKEKLGDTMEVYIDDMVVKSKRKEDHLKDLEEAFNILDAFNMKLNPSKCHFGVKAGKFLGYMVTKRGIEASPEQIKAIINLKSPANTKDVQRLTGRIAALNRFISRSSDKCKHFYDILRKNQKFEWAEKHEQALQELKDYLSSAPLLMKPEDNEPLFLYLAVSGNAVSVVLVKDHEGHQHPVYYVSKTLLDAETRYSHLEKLILALVMAATKLRHYFEIHTIHVKTNYPIKNVLRKPEMSGRMAKWAVKMSAYDIIYEPRTAIKSQALADFVADFSDDLIKEADLEVQQLEEDKGLWILHTDGASNVRGTGLGILLKSPQGDIIPQSISCEFQATNNEAEYEALIAGLHLAKDMGIRYLQVFVDSLLITNHFNGSYAVKGERLSQYLEIVKKLSRDFVDFKIMQVPREENTEADALANLASSMKIPEGMTIAIIHILEPATQQEGYEVRSTSENRDQRIQDPSEDKVSWTVPIRDYIQHGTIPTNENPKAFRTKVSRYTLINDVLYRQSLAGPYLRCLEEPEIQEVLEDIHGGDCGNHTRAGHFSKKF
ncbi:hypothetical protein QVD17_07181 [Tagetes erecta]|uniref:Reverse transcriptase n=1 Tax=Tagetes erecta TaxID=13708 RepID=A0AAD8PCG8_TARER|nr:hypothetical protein QVD17_07181 [Tagetes erecta]